MNPGAKVRLRLVLEEFGANPWKSAPSKPPQVLKGVHDEKDTLKSIPDPEAPPGVTRFLLVGKNADIHSAGDPGLHPKDAKGLTHEIPGIIPSEADWQQKSITKGDTLTFKIKWVDFPIDPRIVRACAVDYYLGCIFDDEYAKGVGGGRRIGEGAGAVNEPFNVVPDDYMDANGQYRSNLRFRGWVDTWELDWGDGEPMVNFTCKDNVFLLSKQEAPSKLVASAISDQVPIDEAVATYLKHFPQFEGLTIEYRPVRTPRDEIPNLKAVLGKSAYVPELGPQQSKGGGGDEKMNVWDYLIDVCSAVAHNIRVEGTTIVIQKAAGMFRGTSAGRPDDPYKTRSTTNGDYPFRALIYGRNLSKLKMKREFNKKEPCNIEARVYDVHNKTHLVARSPKDIGDRIQKKLPGDKDEAKWKVIKAPPGVRDQATLQTIADAAYEQLGRMELSATLETCDMWSFGGDDHDPDLLDMKPTDIVQISVNRDQLYSTLTNIEKALKSQELNAVLFQRMGYGTEFSQAVAKAYADAGFQREFLVREVGAKWGITTGVSLTIQAVNFIEARVDKDPDKAAKDEAADAKAKGKLPANKIAPPRANLAAIKANLPLQAAIEAANKAGPKEI